MPRVMMISTKPTTARAPEGLAMLMAMAAADASRAIFSMAPCYEVKRQYEGQQLSRFERLPDKETDGGSNPPWPTAV